MNINFTPELLAGIIGVIITLIFTYFPKLRVAYGGLASETKSLIMLGLLALVAVAITLLAQYKIIQTSEPITWWLFVKVLFAAIIANQPTYTILPPPPDVTAAKLART